MQQKRNDVIEIDLLYLIRMVLKNWWLVLALSLAALNIAFVVRVQTYVPRYETTTIFTVSEKGIYTSLIKDIASTSSIAKTFSAVLESSVLKRKIAEEVADSQSHTSYEATMVEETNMIELKVQSDSAEMAYRTMAAIMKNYNTVTDSVMGSVNLRVLHPAQMPERPENSRDLIKICLLAFLAMAVVVSGCLGLVSAMKDTVCNEEDAENKIDARFLGEIYHDKNGKRQGSRKKKKVESMLISNPLLSFSYVESTKLVAARVIRQLEHQNMHTLMVSSVAPNEGKSTVASNLAIAMAKEGKRVLLVDWDFRRPALYKVFDIPKEKAPNMSKYMQTSKKEPFRLIRFQKSELYLALNSRSTEMAGDRLTAGLLQSILLSMKEKPDYVIIDTAPLSVTADSEEVAKIVDGAVIVLHQDYVPIRDINDTVDALTDLGTTVIGCVLNNVKGSGRSKQYGGNYGNYEK